MNKIWEIKHSELESLTNKLQDNPIFKEKIKFFVDEIANLLLKNDELRLNSLCLLTNSDNRDVNVKNTKLLDLNKQLLTKNKELLEKFNIT